MITSTDISKPSRLSQILAAIDFAAWKLGGPVSRKKNEQKLHELIDMMEAMEEPTPATKIYLDYAKLEKKKLKSIRKHMALKMKEWFHIEKKMTLSKLNLLNWAIK